MASGMSSTIREVALALVGAATAMTLSACTHAGDLSIQNDGPEDISVDTGEREFEVDGYGGIILLKNGCTPGDVTITFATGAKVVISGPVCPENEIIVGEGTANLRPSTN